MRSQVLTLALLTLVVSTSALAGEHGHGKSNGKGHGWKAFCPHCGEACYPTVTKGKETKHCFETEVKTICIPKVTFPWQGSGLNLSFGHVHGKGKGKCGHDGCGGHGGCGDKGNCLTTCGRTKDVNVLIKHEYECTVCKYSWDPAGFKGDAKDDAKNLDPAEPAAGEATVPPPPEVEARRQPSAGYVMPISIQQTPDDAETAPREASRTRGGIFSSFFR